MCSLHFQAFLTCTYFYLNHVQMFFFCQKLLFHILSKTTYMSNVIITYIKSFHRVSRRYKFVYNSSPHGKWKSKCCHLPSKSISVNVPFCIRYKFKFPPDNILTLIGPQLMLFWQSNPNFECKSTQLWLHQLSSGVNKVNKANIARESK